MLLKDTHDEQDQTIHQSVSEIQSCQTRMNERIFVNPEVQQKDFRQQQVLLL